MATSTSPQQQKARRSYAIAQALKHWRDGLRDELLYGATLHDVSTRFGGLTGGQKRSLASFGVAYVVESKTPGPGPSPWEVGKNLGAGVDVIAGLATGWLKELLGYIAPRAGLVLLYPALTALAGILIVFGLSRSLGSSPGALAGAVRGRLTAGAEATDEIPF